MIDILLGATVFMESEKTPKDKEFYNIPYYSFKYP